MNRIDSKLQYEAPAAEEFKLSSAPMNICIQFSGDADFEDFEEGEARPKGPSFPSRDKSSEVR